MKNWKTSNYFILTVSIVPHVTPPDTIASFEAFVLLPTNVGVTSFMVTLVSDVLIAPALPFSTVFVTFEDSEVFGV